MATERQIRGLREAAQRHCHEDEVLLELAWMARIFPSLEHRKALEDLTEEEATKFLAILEAMDNQPVVTEDETLP